MFLHVHTHVREDAIILYGFPTRDERQCFESLIAAHGVGPAVALALLSIHSPAALRRAVAADDAAALTLVPGVGAKTASRLLIELKTRLDFDLDLPDLVERGPRQERCTAGPRAEVRVALAGLGYGADEVRDALGAPPRGRVAGGAAALRAATPGRAPVREEIIAATGRPVSGAVADPVEAAEESNLRPRRLAEFVGQAQLKEHLSIVLEAARRRGQAVDHLLFAGPPGLGKTTMAGIVATEMGAGLRITSGPALVRAGDLAAILTDLAEGDVLFIDEIHRLGRAVEEIMYPAMEDFALDIVLGKGPAARSHPPRPAPLHPGRGHDPDRAHHRPAAGPVRFRRPPRLLRARGAGGDHPALRSDPRRQPRRRRGDRDRRPVPGHAPHRQPTAEAGPRLRRGPGRRPRRPATWPARAWRCSGSTGSGLDKVDRAILDALCARFGGGPVGLSTLAVSVGEETDTVEDVYEPFLMQLGLLMRTPRGRVATPAAWRHLGLEPPVTVTAPASAFRLSGRGPGCQCPGTSRPPPG